MLGLSFACGAFRVLTYLAVSSILNIALGYALASYLGQTRAPRTVSTINRSNPPASEPVAPTTTTTPLAATAARLDPQPVSVQPAEEKGWAEAFLKSETAAEPTPSEPVAAQPLAVDLTGAPQITPIADEMEAAARPPVEELPVEEEESATVAPAPASAEVERELLAGIEEFRNQLAQLKSGAAEPSPAAQPAAVATN
jgi:hypothetical protein